MFRRWLPMLALSAVAGFAVASPVAAGSCCECVPQCPPAQYIPVLELPEVTPIYVVNQGPIYTGPGIVAFPTTYKVHQSIGLYPYVRDGYWHPKHHHQHVVLWHEQRVDYIDVKAPHRRWLGHRTVPYRSAPPRIVRPPLDPRDK
jgi:hypothetical protein